MIFSHINPILIVVPIIFSLINMLELTAVLSRYAGIQISQHMMGYSLQQAVYIFTRFLIVLLMPLLGYLTDIMIDSNSFINMASSSLFLSFLVGMFVFLVSPIIVKYYIRVINRYSMSGSFVGAMLSSIFKRSKKSNKVHILREYITALKDKEVLKITLVSSCIFGIYGSGIFVAFYFSLQLPEYRATISQMSGIINAFGAVLLTFIVEPLLAKRIDQNSDNAAQLVIGIFVGRLLGLLLVGQAILLGVRII